MDMFKELFPSQIQELKKELLSLIDDQSPFSYKRISKSSAEYLLKEIVELETENAEMKEKLAQINTLSST